MTLLVASLVQFCWRIFIKVNIVGAHSNIPNLHEAFLKHWRQIKVLLRKLIWLHKSFSSNQSQFRKTENFSQFPRHVMSESILFQFLKYLNFILFISQFTKYLHFVLFISHFQKYLHFILLISPQYLPYYLPPQAENVARCGRNT